ncbi:protein TolR [Methylogaea oryzae]|uniref:Tol-Pal system protein TolR n=2 Tax=Methylogaea oryzae TaxID=1295382 RepID=A0A8D5AH89_9GAMM|nr:protein TolR [Methylogaea oryzae]BBL71218.1 protein TolR [Methylogaea oryzae]
MNVPGRGGGRRKPMAEINVVPYIDVSLVLLIIFMITAPLVQNGVDVDLPQAAAKTVEVKEDKPPIVVSIKADGSFYVDLGDHDDQPVAQEELMAKVMAALRLKPGTEVLIRGDKAVDYGRVVTAMAALKQAGVPSVGLMTNPAE